MEVESGFDANIDSPEQWDNEGKYPLMLANSCYTGDIYQPTTSSSSEQFVLANKSGSIAYLASVSVGLSLSLDFFTTNFYNNISFDNYGASIGDNIRQTISTCLEKQDNFSIRSMLYSFAYHGDPALKLYNSEKPDIALSLNDISITPTTVSPADDSLFVKVIISNLGKSFTESFGVSMTRTLPNCNIMSKNTFVNGLNFQDSLFFSFPIVSQNGVGVNMFEVSADLPINEIDEEDDYVNNEVTQLPYYLTGFGVVPLYPYEFSVIPKDTVTLVAQTLDYFAKNNDYIFQIDTTKLFNSSLLNQGKVNSDAGVFSYTPPINLTDSTVYYWRVSIDQDNKEWSESSFRYIDNQRGWSQASFRQYDKDKFEGLIHDTLTGKFNYSSSSMPFRVSGSRFSKWNN